MLKILKIKIWTTWLLNNAIYLEKVNASTTWFEPSFPFGKKKNSNGPYVSVTSMKLNVITKI